MQAQTTELLTQAQERAVLEERTRLAREIHDTIAQGLAGVAVQVGAARQGLTLLDGAEQRQLVADLSENLSLAERMARETLAEARRSVWNLRQPLLELGGLRDALEQVAAHAQLRVVASTAGEPWPLAPAVDSALLRVGQEALANSVRHGAASAATVALSYSERAVELRVADDGRGFPPELLVRRPAPGPWGGFGLLGMQQRIGALGGQLLLSNAGGACVHVVVPRAQAELRRWIDEEPLLVLAGTAAMLGALLLLPWRRLVGVLGICTAMLWIFLGRGGIVIEFYLVPLLPLLAINLGLVGGLAAGWLRQGLSRIKLPALWITLPLGLGALCAFGAWRGLNGPNYGFNTSPLTLWTSTQADAQGQAVAWVREHLPPDSRMIIDQSLWLDLRDAEAGPTFPLAHYYWKADLDPEIRDDVFANTRRNVDYIITTPQLSKDVRFDDLPLVAETLIHSTPIIRFDTGGWPVEVREVRELYPDTPTDVVLARTWASYKARFIQGGRVSDPGRGGDSTSEGQSYALLRAVYADDRATFDEVWDWTQANLQQPGGQLAWLYGTREGAAPAVVDAGSATDADQDTALALLLASRRWAEPTYARDAQTMLDGIWEHETAVVAGRRVAVAGDWARGDAESLPVINPSYFAPYAYRIFAEADPARPWGELVDSAYTVLDQLHADARFGGGRGLLPTWVALEPTTGALAPAEGLEQANSFGYDGLRAPWRLTLDWLWFHDERAREALGRFTFLRERLEQEGKLDAVYRLDGTPEAGHESLAMYAGVVPALLFSGGEQIAFQTFDQKLGAAYHDDGQTAAWGDPDNYYDQNWAWFTTALLDGTLGNLWAGDERLDWSGVVAN